jgi:hypothetical protein
MDLISFLHKRGELSRRAFSGAFKFLVFAQDQKGYIDFEEIHLGLQFGADLTEWEVNAHTELIYGKCLFEF